MGDMLREKLANLEHEQWMAWTKYLVDNENLSRTLIERWKKNWKPYLDLDENVKDADRIWADKVLKLIKEEREK